MAQAFGYTADLALDRDLAQLLRLRVAQLNPCAYCLILHTQKSREAGIDDARISNLGAWWQSELYTDAEQAAFRYTEALNAGVDRAFQAKHDALREHFTEREVAEIAAVVINMNVWTRLKLAQGATPRVTS
ncbi:MAG: carboxymuconolactone decarboxylase family protein [Myxococcota bacterium]